MDLNDLYPLCETLGSKLKLKAWSLALAESCTGGLLAAALTQVPGCSHWFDCGVVSYSNAAKLKLLQVPQASLDEQGAVSAQVARFMAEGMLASSLAHLALAITGIAGPEGGSPEKPVGLVYLAIAARNQPSQVREQHFTGTRAEIRYQSTRYALEWLIDFI